MIQRDRLLKIFLELIQIDSLSGEEVVFGKHLAKRLEILGATVAFDTYGNLIAKFDGKGKPFFLNAHLDTVEPGRKIQPHVKGDIIRSDGSTIVGGDAKAGIAVLLEALTSIKEGKKQTRPLEIVFTREEETSLGGAYNLDYKKISAKEGLVFDGDEQVYKVFVSSPTYYAIDVVITGRSAHAGMEPEKGISAIRIASEIISKLPLGRIDNQTTANVGTIHGGSVRNAVPESVTISGELRSRNLKKLQTIRSKMEAIIKQISNKYPKAKIQATFTKEADGFTVKKNHPLLKHILSVMQSMKMKPVLVSTCGVSDANIFITHGIETVIVGTGVYEPHTTREYVKISEMEEAARFCERFLLV